MLSFDGTWVTIAQHATITRPMTSLISYPGVGVKRSLVPMQCIGTTNLLALTPCYIFMDKATLNHSATFQMTLQNALYIYFLFKDNESHRIVLII